MSNKKLISVLLVISLLLTVVAGCNTQTATPSEAAAESSEDKNAETATDGTPQYGGTLTLISELTSHSDPPGWFIHSSPSINAAFWVSPVQEFMFVGDVLKKGPRGTGEGDFTEYQGYYTDDLITGYICDSWEFNDDTLVLTLHVKEGVTWQSNEKIGMESRELTADDIAFFLNNYRSSAKKSKMSPFTDENPATATDKYTVEVQFTKPYSAWMWIIGYVLYCNVYPKEMVDADPENWQNLVGTGPFKIEDYVTGSQVVYEKNGEWWNAVQTIDGTDYETPFIDKLVYPIMPDVATRIAAIVSGKVDIAMNAPYIYKELLESAAPELNVKESPSGTGMNVQFNSLTGPCSDVEFRRALMVGTNEQAIADVIPGASIGGFPYTKASGPDVFTPIDEMPKEIAALYGYDPEAAKAKIEELGYAGAAIGLYYLGTVQDCVTTAEMLADQWEQLGLVVNLHVCDQAVLSGIDTGDGSDWQGAFLKYPASGDNGPRSLDYLRAQPYLSIHTDEAYNEAVETIMAENDGDKRNAMMKEWALYLINQVDSFMLYQESTVTCWWPWVKNYYGETETGCTSYNPLLTTLWIDQNMKAEMGY